MHLPPNVEAPGAPLYGYSCAGSTVTHGLDSTTRLALRSPSVPVMRDRSQIQQDILSSAAVTVSNPSLTLAGAQNLKIKGASSANPTAQP